MASVMERLTAAGEATGLSLDKGRKLLHGTFRGYSFVLPLLNNNQRFVQVHFSVSRSGLPLSAVDGKQIAKDSNKLVQFVKPAGNLPVSFLVKLEKEADAAGQKVADGLNYLVDAFAAMGYENTCQRCHRNVATDVCAQGAGLTFLCDECFDAAATDLADQKENEAQTSENVVAGIVGAFLGALLGAVAVVVIGRLGFVASISGLIAAVCSLKGYELLAKKMSLKGCIIACVAMLVMIYVGHRADWAIEAAIAFEADFFRAFKAIPWLIEEGAITPASYWGGLALTMVFAIVGAAPTVVRTMKGQSTKFTLEKLQ